MTDLLKCYTYISVACVLMVSETLRLRTSHASSLTAVCLLKGFSLHDFTCLPYRGRSLEFSGPIYFSGTRSLICM
jgi:hypothetical protein